MAVILKKDEKIEATISELPKNYTIANFIEKFQELYPKDWEKLIRTYQEHTKDLKPGKKQPMPKPEQYLKNTLSVWKNKNSNT